MGDKKSGVQSRKRISKVLQEEYWNCSVCTYTNSPEAFKCSICDVRKGTSTRKPRLNQHIVAQQEATRLVAQMPHSPTYAGAKDETEVRKSKPESEVKLSRPRLKGIDRSTPITMAVTVDNVTVMFTEFKPKKSVDGEEKSKNHEKRSKD